MMIQIQNVTFFPQKNMFLICRGMKKVWVAFNQKGVLMVKLKGFGSYWIDPTTMEVYSKKSDKTYSIIKKYLTEKEYYFNMYRNGVQSKVYLWQILIDNIKGIEVFLTESKSLSTLSH